MKFETVLTWYLNTLCASLVMLAIVLVADAVIVKFSDWQRRRRDRSSNSGRKS